MARFHGSGVFLLFRTPPGRRLRQSNVSEGQLRSQRNQLVQRVLSENLIDPLAITGHWRRDQHGVGCGMQLEMFLRMRQCIMRDKRCDVRKLGGFGFQKFLSRRRIKEKVADGDGCSRGKPSFLHPENLPSVDLDDGA